MSSSPPLAHRFPTEYSQLPADRSATEATPLGLGGLGSSWVVFATYVPSWGTALVLHAFDHSLKRALKCNAVALAANPRHPVYVVRPYEAIQPVF